MDHEEELTVEIACLKAEIITIKGRIARDRRYAEEHLKVELRLATNEDKRRLQRQIEELERTVANEKAFIDRIVVYLRKKSYLREGKEEDDE